MGSSLHFHSSYFSFFFSHADLSEGYSGVHLEGTIYHELPHLAIEKDVPK